MLDAVPLTPADRTILDLECETIAGHTCKVVLLGPGAPDLEQLRERVAERIDSAPELTRRLGGDADAPAWVPDDSVDLAAHVRASEIEAPLDREAVLAEVASLFEQRLDRSRPLWRMDLVPTPSGGAALVWRLHHALADGTAAMRFAKALLWDESVPAGGAEETKGASHPPHQHPDEARRRGHLARFIDHEFAESLRRSPFDGNIGTHRRIAFASAPLKELHDAAKGICGATLNDAVLALVAGSLRRWIQHHHGSLGSIRVQVPVSLHEQGDHAGNRDSFFSLPLPLHQVDAARRLELIHAATKVRKEDHDAEALEAMLEGASGISPGLADLLRRIESSPRRFAVSVSNVPGPREPVSVLGAPVEEMHTIAEIGRRHGLRISVVSLAGRLYFGFCADPALVDDLDAMAEGIEIEAADLVAVAG